MAADPIEELGEAVEAATEMTGLAPPAPEPAPDAATGPTESGVLGLIARPLTLSNFLIHPTFYRYVTHWVVFPFVGGVCYAFGECWARVLMGRWGYLPAVMAKKTGKAIDSFQDSVLNEIGYQRQILDNASVDGIALRSMIFGTVAGGMFGYQAVAPVAAARGKQRRKVEKRA